MNKSAFTNLQLFEQQLKLASHIDGVNNALKKYLLTLGITTFSFTYYSYYLNALNKLKYDYSSANFKSWHKHYIEEKYEEIDTTLKNTYQSSLPTLWVLEDQLKKATSLKERQMRLDSIEFGAVKGVTVPIHGPKEDFAHFLLVQMRGENCLEHWEELQYELFIAGYYYYSYLQKYLLKNQESVEKFKLTRREIQCLHLIAKGLSVADVSKSLNITERTVNYHIQRFNKKLGTKNKHQSVAKAIQKKLIEI